ncbi:MAG: phosphatidate cytidylyltransferase [Caldivirga sp.]|uniref:phosphatidate cytidylyltransferase n=1 Tax=Caldivirga sp. TaxID=2080243 RepID=UPI003D1185E3
MVQNLNRINKVKALLYRKLIHLLLSILLIVPLVVGLEETYIEVYYTVLLIGSSFLYIYQVKRPLISVVIRDTLEDARNNVRLNILRVAEMLNMTSVKELIASMDKLEYTFSEFIKNVERDYERKWGYLGVVMGMVGVYASYVLVNTYAYYGVLALMFYDTFSALFGSLIGRTKMPYSSTTIEGIVMGALVFSLVVGLLVGLSYFTWLYLVGIALGVVESYSGEDNLAIPVTASLLAYFLRFPRI